MLNYVQFNSNPLLWLLWDSVYIMGHPHHFRQTPQFQLNGITVPQILDLAKLL